MVMYDNYNVFSLKEIRMDCMYVDFMITKICNLTNVPDVANF